MPLCCPSVHFCGPAPVDPHAVTTAVGAGEGAVVTYTCLTGYQDSTPDSTYTMTCTDGSWTLAAGTTCTGQFYSLLDLIWVEWLNLNLKLTNLSHRTLLTSLILLM